MTEALPGTVFSFERLITYQEIIELPKHTILKDWYGKEILQPIEFTLALDPEKLWFHVEWANSPLFEEHFNCGDFVEGLWQKDCAELFLCDDQSSAYQEFNLSPAGAWWSTIFSNYRTNSSIIVPHNLARCYLEAASEITSATLAIQRNLLGIKCSFAQDTRLNVSYISNSPDQQFATWMELASERPDFHLTNQFGLAGICEMDQI